MPINTRKRKLRKMLLSRLLVLVDIDQRKHNDSEVRTTSLLAMNSLFYTLSGYINDSGKFYRG